MDEKITYTIYVVRLEDGCFYVGRTKRPIKKIESKLMNPEKRKFTRLHPPIEIAYTEKVSDEQQSEQRELELLVLGCRKYGLEKVRGLRACILDDDVHERTINNYAKRLYGKEFSEL